MLIFNPKRCALYGVRKTTCSLRTRSAHFGDCCPAPAAVAASRCSYSGEPRPADRCGDRPGICDLYGLAGAKNATGDAVKKLDVLSNEVRRHGPCVFFPREGGLFFG